MIILNNNIQTPKYIQIYEQLRNEIIRGELPEGSKLVSTRYLAESLAVGRNTVEKAYLQLSSEGYVESRVGSGFYVQNIHNIFSLGNDRKNVEFPTEHKERKLQENIICNFQYGYLSPQDFPQNIWRKVSMKALASLNAEDMTMYSDPKGELQLRKELAEYLRKSRGVTCSTEQIILCSGLESALSLLSQLFRNIYSQIAFEEPGYFGAREIFEHNGFNTVSVSVGKDGVNVNELEKSSAQVIYVTPSHQFPTGAVMPIQKRLRLLEWAVKNNGIIIEDDYDSELRYNTRPIPSISNVSGNDNVIYIGTMSKSLSPSLRVSYMVLPQKWLNHYNKEFKLYQSPVSIIQQRILYEFIHSGHFESHLRKLCVINKRKHDLLVRLIHELMSNEVVIHGKHAGLHILLESTQGLTEKEMIDRAKEYGVLVYPVSIFWHDVHCYSNNMVLLSFGNVSEKQLTKGIEQLSKAWNNTICT